jgi:hypothetical protein
LTVTGCSLVYNPSDLPGIPIDGKPDPDAEIVLDADPTQLVLERVSPAIIFEGTGTGGSRKGVITVHGKQIVPGAKITIAPHAGAVGDPMITIDDAATDVSDNGFYVAAPFTIQVNPALAAAATIRLDVTVTQPTGSGDVSQTLTELPLPSPDETPVLVLEGLAELTDETNAPLPTANAHEYSQVMITGGLSAADTNGPLIIRVRGSASITGTSAVNANNQSRGAGAHDGGDGGPGELLDGSLGSPGGGPGGGQPNAGGGGFAVQGGGGTGGPPSGQPQIISHASNSGNGGAGGNGEILGAAGGAGGGGGGSIEVTAGGMVEIGPIEARGGNGSAGATTGGGGSGGLVLLRGASITAGTVNVGGGNGTNTGSIGRIRVDTPITAAPTTNPPAYRGPMFDAATPLLTRSKQPILKVFGQPGATFSYVITDDQKQISRGPFASSIAAGGSNMVPLAEELFRGLNTICVRVDGGGALPEAQNCIDLVHVFMLER